MMRVTASSQCQAAQAGRGDRPPAEATRVRKRPNPRPVLRLFLLATLFAGTNVAAQTVPPDIDVTPRTLSFADQTVGTTSAAWEVQIRNVGGSALSMRSLVSSSADFAVSVAGGLPATVAAGGSFKFQVRFTPSIVGNRAGNLSISSGDPDEPVVVVACTGNGVLLPPDIDVSPLTLAFADQTVGTTSTARDVLIRNVGGSPLSMGGLASSSGDFAVSVAGGLPASLAAGASFTAQVRFTPSSASNRAGSISISSADPDEPVVVVACSGKGVLLPPDIDVSPLTLAFGDQTVGTTSAARDVLIRNVGGSPLSLGSLASSSGDFAVTVAGGLPASLAAGASFTAQVRFTPSSAGNRAGNLSISSADPDEPVVVVACTGKGVLLPPDIDVSPLTLAFGDQTVGTTSAARDVLIRNVGGSPLSLGSLASSSGDFAVTVAGGLPASLAAGASFTAQVRFTPSSAGNRAGNLSISSADPDEPVVVVACTGNGVLLPPDIDVSPLTLAFGDQTVGTTSTARDVLIRNVGGSPLSMGGLASSSGDFAVSVAGGLPASLAAGASFTAQVRFTPSSASNRAGSISISSADPDEPVVVVACSGKGVLLPPDIDVSPLTLAFGDQTVGTTSAARDVLIRNVGGSPLSMGSLASSSGDFAVTVAGGLPASLAAGASFTAQVRFTPSSASNRAGSISISSADPDEPVVVVACTGKGVLLPPDIDVSPLTLAFGDQTVGTTSAARDVLIRNVGGSPLSLGSLASSSGDFAVTVAGGLPGSLAAGASFTAQVRFTPSIAGNRAGNLSISSSDPDEPVVVVACSGTGEAWDFGDAPDPAYPTRLAHNGARHRLSPLFLGGGVDGEVDGQPNVAADGDDLEGGPDDEDGVLFMGPLSPGAVGRVTVVASAAGNLNAWIDFNQNGGWEPTEQIFRCRAVAAGPNVLEFTLPPAIPTGHTYARFRLSTLCGLGPDGVAPDGEVEDDRVQLEAGGTASATVVLPFSLEGPDSVFFHLFNVNTAGTVRIEVSWEGDSRELAFALTGRRRSNLPDATAPYARTVGPAPATLSYEVTPDDLRRGVGWRLAIGDPARVGEARGTVTLTLPFDPQLEAAMRREKVSLRSGDFWPSASLQDRFLAGLAASRGDGLHALISLRRALTCVENEELERLGLIRQSHLAKPGWHSFGLVRKGINLGHPLLRDVLLRITPLEPEDKVDPHILLGNFARFEVVTDDEIPANTVLNPDGTLELSVLFARDVARADIPAILGAEAVSFEAMSDTHWRITLAPGRLLGLAAREEVEWIGGGPAPPMADNNNTRAAINVAQVQNVTAINAGPPPTITYGGLTGLGITAGVQDTGIDATHPDFTNNVVIRIAALAAGAHGTHVAGILAGSGIQSSTNDAAGNRNGGLPFQWAGMAPQAALISSGDLDNAANLLRAIEANSLDLVNRSQSISFDGDYDDENQRVDSLIRGSGYSEGARIPRRTHVYSAGNHGTIPVRGGNQIGYFAITKQMKNVIIVGNWDAINNDLSASSSLGPCQDGRIKPDLVAPGGGDGATAVRVTSTGFGTSAWGYRSTGGTSMASPAVAGVVALLLQAWQNTYSLPMGTTIDASPPFPSTLRALLIQTANDQATLNNNVRNLTHPDVDSDSNPAIPANIVGQADGLGTPSATTGPDYTTGWGLVDAQAAVNLLQDFRTEYGQPVPNRIIQDAVHQNGVREYDFVVNEVGPLQVTLAWDDVEGAQQNPATSPVLVNDLDLELVDPNGVVLYPWQLGQTIQDANGNPLPNNAQPPGTAIRIAIPIPPTPTPAANNDYVPANALAGNGAWVATQGKDHLNNVEQVFVPNVAANQLGHWKARVLGFDVRDRADDFSRDYAQDFSLVGFPYPELAELVASCTDKVGLPDFDTPLEFTWTVANVGALGTGVGFNYRVLLSRDFYADADDVELADANQAELGPLAAGASLDQISSVQINADQARQVLDKRPDTGVTAADLVSADVFLLVQVDAADVVLEHNEVNVASVQIARLVDVVLLMDRSGSMRSEVPVSSGNRTKMALLQDSANLFLDLLRLDAGDALAQVSFSRRVTTDFGPDGALTPTTADSLEQARDAVDALEAGSSTDIRAGFERGLEVMTDGSDANRRRVLVFFSDGMRTAGGNPTAPEFLARFDDNDVTVYSVGFGTERGTACTGIDLDLLGTLANANPAEAGFFHVTESAKALDKFFVNALAGAIRAEVVVDPEGDLAGGATEALDLFLGRQDASATFILTWDDPARSLDLAVRSPSGFEINAANAGLFADRVSLIDRPSYRVMTVRFPLVGGPSMAHAGQWRVFVHNPGDPRANPLHYAVSVITESTLRADLRQPRSAGGGPFRPGNPIPLEVTLKQSGGGPVPGATVTVTPNVPLVSLGSLLAVAGITAEELAGIPQEMNDEPLSQQERMYLALLARLGGGNLLPRADAIPFELAEDTLTGGYAGSFSHTQIEGAYNFVARIEGVTPGCERFQREVFRSVGVSPVVEPAPGSARVAWDDPENPLRGVTVTVTPVTVGGHRLGPGLASRVVVNAGEGLAPAGGLVDNLDGGYSQHFTLQTPGLVTFSIAVGGVNLPRLVADAQLPAPLAVAPAGGPNHEVTPIEVFFAAGADLSSVVGITLMAGNVAVPLGRVRVNQDGPSILAEVPSGLPPEVYAILVEGPRGQGPVAAGVDFRVVGRGQDYPGSVDAIASRLQTLELAGTQAEGLAQLGLLLRDLRGLATGPNLTTETRRAAYNQVAEFIRRGRGPTLGEPIVAIRSLENAARIDARSVLLGPIPTPDGSNVRVELGNGVAATFGLVTAAGQTSLQLRQGPDDIPAANRGTPHAAYDIATTAQFDTVRGLSIQFEYVEGDFPDESLLRVLHFEQGRWIDRTVDLEVEKNLIRARVSDLSPFVIVSGTPSPEPVLRALGFGLADGFALELDGPPGAYEIHRSDNLEAWTLAGTVDRGMAAVRFYDPGADSVSARFYRAVRVR